MKGEYGNGVELGLEGEVRSLKRFRSDGRLLGDHASTLIVNTHTHDKKPDAAAEDEDHATSDLCQ